MNNWEFSNEAVSISEVNQGSSAPFAKESCGQDKGKFFPFLFPFWEAQKFEDRSLSLPKLRFKGFNLPVSDRTNWPGILNTMLFFIPHFFINFHCKLLSAASARTKNLSLAMCINISLTRTEICTRLPFNISMPGRLLARDVEVSIWWGHYAMVTWIFLHFRGLFTVTILWREHASISTFCVS